MMIDEYYTWLICGYHSGELKPKSHKYVVVVCDKCGVYDSIPMYRYNRNNDMCRPCALGTKRTPKQNAALSKIRLAPKDPLPDGWESKLIDITNNKSSPVYLGSIAEVILSNIYNDVRVMPNGNHGFDVICNREYKIDVKASATGYKGRWHFNIIKNKIADYFLCIAFESRDDLHNPVHLWMIPGEDVNHMAGIRISKSTLDKWNKYELSLDKLVVCCNDLADNVKEVI